MAGNAWEWTESSYSGYPGNTYEQAQDFGDYFKVVRGGSWDNIGSHLRSTFRQNNEPRLRSDGTGFRCAVSADAFEPAPVGAAPTEEAPPAAPTVEPTIEPTTEPTIEPTTEPTTEPTVEPTTEPGAG